MVIYIAGPITGHFDYRNKFKEAEAMISKLGHTVINPSTLPPGLKSNEDYMHICKSMIDVADGVYFLKGWENSKGAMEEHSYSVDKDKMIFEESNS